MDIYCKRCGEPWDLYGVEHGDMTDEECRRFWRGKGCPSCYRKPIEEQPFRGQLTTVLHDVLGDDLDGLASELEDAESLLGEDFWD